MRWRTSILLGLPLLCHAEVALAWGLYTHLYFAQLLVWVVPLADPALRRAVRRFPRWLLAGACLPDLSLVSRTAGTAAFRRAHRWQNVHVQLDQARSEEELAMVVGFASHLLADVIAHNHFVPAHQRLWLDLPMATHALAEWAMDVHLAAGVYARPKELLVSPPGRMADFVAAHFGCTPEQARKAFCLLGRADSLLRASRIPSLAYGTARRLDERLLGRFDYYVGATAARLAQINRLLEGEAPQWEAEVPCPVKTEARFRGYSPEELLERLPLPGDLFCQTAG
jgi:Zinc dependent phospholipase C